jgi:hypothetical protein
MESNQQLDNIRAYIKKHDLQGVIAQAVSKCVQILPEDPVDFLAKQLAESATGTAPVSLDQEAAMIFAKADADHDGKLTKNEIKKFMQSNADLKQAFRVGVEGGWAKLWADVDEDGDGAISLTEWQMIYNMRMGGKPASKAAAAPEGGEKKESKKQSKKEKKAAKKGGDGGGKAEKAPDPEADAKALSKKIKGVEKEGGKKGVEIEGAADMGGLAFFCTTLMEPDGDMEMLVKGFAAMNAEPPKDPEEERRGGAGGVGKMVFSAGPEGLAIVCNVPKEVQVDKENQDGPPRKAMFADKWVQTVLSRFEKEAGKIDVDPSSNSDFAKAFIPANKDIGFFALKFKDDAMSYAYQVLTEHNAMPAADSSPGECIGDFEDDY